MGPILGLSLLLLFVGHLVPPANGGRYAACQVLCGGGPYDPISSYPGFFYKPPDFTGPQPRQEALDGRFFGGSVNVGWEDHNSHEEVDLSGFQYTGALDGTTRFRTVKVRNHTKESSGGKFSIKLGLAAGQVEDYAFNQCRYLCRVNGFNMETGFPYTGLRYYYPGFDYRLPDFMYARRPSLSGRFFGISSQTGWEKYQSDEVEEKEGYNINHRFGQKFETNIKRKHHTKKKGGQTVVRIGVA
ncbi:unnamed protein product [Orchesella dallaii]|uniref:Uncharacterized protein n=1 Tax=Orchesella dallaii TaxID=48710 RepID=A0ABP1RW09_9HEXA